STLWTFFHRSCIGLTSHWCRPPLSY
ncbi:liporeleasing system, transmembrane protein LolE, partial [Vibrio parahaemolyticus V-223/04]